jgi:hypothetical protein
MGNEIERIDYSDLFVFYRVESNPHNSVIAEKHSGDVLGNLYNPRKDAFLVCLVGEKPQLRYDLVSACECILSYYMRTASALSVFTPEGDRIDTIEPTDLLALDSYLSQGMIVQRKKEIH